ncbi:MAG: DNA polymerase/3'-5' exonuclease PolX [Syntrophaceae bacterium]
MPVTKKDIAAVLDNIGVLLELKGEHPFKARAYYNAARCIENLEEDIHLLISEDRLSSLKGIGSALDRKIRSLALTGSLDYYDELKSSVPPGHLEMLRIQGLGPKKIRKLHENLNIETLGELEYACRENRLLDLPGFGRKSQENILTGIDSLKRFSEKRLFVEAAEIAGALLEAVQGSGHAIRSSIAGSLRRRNEVVKDIDIVASSERPAELAALFTGLPQVERITSKGETKASIALSSGINADLRIVTEREFPFALHHFTGSKEHNVAMRSRAIQMKLKMNEYGLFSDDGPIACASEEEIFAALGLAYIPPELRENCGEIEAAAEGALPVLVEMKDIRGVFHVHTTASDGTCSLKELAGFAKGMGLEYIGIADHSRSAYYAGGLSIDQVRRQHAEIDEMNRKDGSFRIFKGIESEILPDGSLDYDDSLLAEFDFVIVAVHSHFSMPEKEMTARVIKALENKRTTMLAHPTGRLLLARNPYRIDMERVIDRAALTNTAIELNSSPHRLDLDWRLCRPAKKQGVRISINPDAHSAEGLSDIGFGINIARKGWLEKSDCLNCMGLKEISDYLSKK